MNTTLARKSALLVLAGCAATACAAWGPSYELIYPGVSDPKFPENWGVVQGMNSSQTAVGYQLNAVDGFAAFYWSRATGPVRIGLYSEDYLDAKGQPKNYISDRVNDRVSFANGAAVGVAYRYDFFKSLKGQASWAWTPQTGSVRVGFFGPANTATDGTQVSDSFAMTGDGNAAGWSYQFSGNSAIGRTAWRWNPSEGTVRIGYYDALHTSSANGAQFTKVIAAYADSILGFSYTYSPAGFQFGQSAWRWRAADGLLRLGYTDAVHTSSAGAQDSEPVGQNTSGMIIGNSVRFDTPSAGNGRTAWVWTAAEGLTRVGLFDANHTLTGGRQVSSVEHVTDGGYVWGTSSRVGPSTSAWFWSRQLGTVRAGYVDATHPYDSAVYGINDSGVVIGTSSRVSGGQTAWKWTSAGGLTRLGLYTGFYVASDTRQVSIPRLINSAGDIVGESAIFSGTNETGRSLWLYRAQTGTTTTLLMPDGTTSNIRYEVATLSDDGVVTGSYYKSASLDNVGHAFKWSPLDGATALDPLVIGGIGAAGFSQVFGHKVGNAAGELGGYGLLTTPGGYVSPYLLLKPQCAADFNGDGFLDFNDFDAFVTQFEAGTSTADFNKDGFIDFTDFDDFVGAFEAGC